MKTTHLDDLSPIVGYRATRIVEEWFPGQYLHVPVTASPTHCLAVLLGLPAFTALVRECAGDRFWIPTHEERDRYRRDRTIAEMLARGASAALVADEMGLSLRRVEQIRVDLVSLRWIDYVQGYDTAKAQARRTAGTARPTLVVPLAEGADATADAPV